MEKIEEKVLAVYPEYIVKRNGQREKFSAGKIEKALYKALKYSEEGREEDAHLVLTEVLKETAVRGLNTVEDIQDAAEEALFKKGYFKAARSFIIYREHRRKMRESEPELMEIYEDLTLRDSKESDTKRENANINADSAMGTMLKYGSEGARYYVDRYILPPHIAELHREGYIHIHDKDFYMLTQTCCQIDLKRLFREGFSTGHGTLSQPKSITSCAALACIILQANQNEMHGGQAIPDFDYAMETGVDHSFEKLISEGINNIILRNSLKDNDSLNIKNISRKTEDILARYGRVIVYGEREKIYSFLETSPYLLEILGEENLKRETAALKVINEEKLRREVSQAMQALIHNLNTMNSRCGAQVPFSSLNYGTSVSDAGRMVTEELLKATYEGLGNGETPIFPVQIFKVKEGVNFREGDKNFDLLKLAMKVSSKRLFPNFSFLDSTFNSQYYVEGNPDTEVSYMGCRTRVMGNVYDKTKETTKGRGNLSFTSMNLPRLGIEAHENMEVFYENLTSMMENVLEQLLHRFKIQSRKKKYNYPFLMGEGIWTGSENLKDSDEVGEVLKNGTLSIGFIGLAECLTALRGSHHGENQKSEELGLEIISFMRNFCDRKSEELKLNISLIATPAEGLSGRFVKMDAGKYGIIPGVTDKEYYTNSFHIPVGYKITMAEKIKKEGPYHELTNGGHISYVEVDGKIEDNISAFYSVLKLMKDNNIGYGSVNHPVDYDPVCGYTGVIDDECPNCKRHETEDEPFHRIRRITGYLVGTLDRFNDAKKSEVNDRVRHN